MNRPRLFLGHVMHRRLRPAVNAFVYPVFYIQLPVRDLQVGNCPIFSVDRSNLLSFRQKDHGARDGSPLLPWIQAQLRQRSLPDDGEITLQCFPRVFGFVFNPVSFWFCRNAEGALIAVLARWDLPRLNVSSRAGVSASFEVATTYSASGLAKRY